ncbi:DNA polymerase III subunit gamma/tau [Neoehrlichia mikurensis]|uniref:DNA polymerase III subunit gamma/tau n=1 Tax=Neoehrlichia mikurensis TaxID=89586 RepID=A0A9Q9F459_9RICK|nr:DNA polymerase III subunit gamma/tau [Neoehrlichia mikurensis]QXK92333.1 DNA polymerase III subunit gamma/tau [Neoehrlichia mikurensis]QXK92787.1 DNA polymerase III subunit gamma/tau [Neoehrlichia mikurensis]QXK94028.1 DNA polymerase III subunit gamma/tau [Neoehrlichia mikurensis]UTO55939.1 DNA polymerase III subunit gamma/tau [Neoehrlichia mikurensis]UTO56722.1 DNA polymerase III subunit gamma/tau [Neoehrlichia mikurensis]
MNLALKYRPNNFKDLVGQEVLVQILQNSFHLNKIPSSILLVGSSGIGKTTSARIISLCLNCSLGPTLDPCNNCVNCISIKNSSNSDVIEIDAASNTGIEDIKIILENSYYLPISCKFKVYIIDEVHMLSNSAFNALLKTLEEPSPHVKFILATTEAKKIPTTVISRCQRFDLEKVSLSNLKKHIKEISLKENFVFDEESINLIANHSEGSVRNALFLLEQSAIYTNNNLSEEKIRKLLGCTGKQELINIFKSIILGNPSKALDDFKIACKSTTSVIVLNDMLQLIYNVCLSSISYITEDNSINELIKLNNEKICSTTFLSRLWQALFKGLQEIKHSEYIYQAAEMLIIRLCYLSNLPSPKQIVDKLYQNKNNQNATSILQKLLNLLKENDKHDLYNHLNSSNSEIFCEVNKLIIVTSYIFPNNFSNTLEEFLQKLTNQKWTITIKEKIDIKNHENSCYSEVVQDILNKFSGAKIINIKN